VSASETWEALGPRLQLVQAPFQRELPVGSHLLGERGDRVAVEVEAAVGSPPAVSSARRLLPASSSSI
jgi:hypothetical protein